MPITGVVFFVFNAKGVARLTGNPSLLDGVDCVISGVPGVSLDALGERVAHLTLEQTLEAFGITQTAISAQESAYCLALMDRDVIARSLPQIGADADESIRLALLNHIGSLTHNAFAFEFLFRALVGNGLRKVRFFRFHGRFRLIERPEIRTLLEIELGFGPQLEHLCDEAGIKKEQVGRGDRLAAFKNALRDLLLLGYKGKTLLMRSWATRRPPEGQSVEAVFITRARTEVVAAEPILRLRARQCHRDIMLVDDLIKSPDGTAAASRGTRDWHPLHSYSKLGEIARISLRCILRRRSAARRGMSFRPERVSEWSFLGRKDIATGVLYTAFASLPELLVHRLQLCRAFETLTPSAIVSFDTVDRWGALQGELARQRSMRSVMIQNTSADDIFYPWPLAMDHLVVGNERLRKIFTSSGADPTRVHAFGLPIQDDVFTAGNARLEALIDRAEQGNSALRLLIATQPFVQEFDYNAALIDSLETVVSELDFPLVLILKPHPREPLGKYETVRDELASRSHSVKLYSGPFEEALSEADVVLSRTSTSLEFAALGGVPSIAHLHGYPRDIVDRLDYLRSSVTEKSFDTSDLRACLKAYAPENRGESLAMYASRRLKFIEEFFPGKGRATVRVADLIAAGSSTC